MAKDNIRRAAEKLVDFLQSVDWMRIRFIPDGANDQLPPVPLQVDITENDIQRAMDDWDETFPDYAGMLDAEVEGDTFEEGSEL